MQKVTTFIGLIVFLGAAGFVQAAVDEPLVNRTFDTDLESWSVFPEQEFVIWDELTQSAMLLPYVEGENGTEDTNSILSQSFLLPINGGQLSFDVKMTIKGPGFETDILDVTIDDNLIYQLTSSQVNTAALNNDPHIIHPPLIDENDEVQYAIYKTTVSTDISNFLGTNVNLAFTLHNDNVDNCETTVNIDNVDISPDSPEVYVVGGMMELWPPNHKYHTFNLSDCVSVMDNLDGQMDVDSLGKIISIYSDEPEEVQGNGDGKSYDDIVILSDSSFKVRSERQGASNGRVYGITFEIADSNGNITRATFYLGVPHDQSGDPPVDDGPGAGYTVSN